MWQKQFNNFVSRIDVMLRRAESNLFSVVPCCADGDSCLTNGLCHYTQSEIGGSGFYAGGCTDGTFNAKTCPQLCSKSDYGAIVQKNQSLI